MMFSCLAQPSNVVSICTTHILYSYTVKIGEGQQYWILVTDWLPILQCHMSCKNWSGQGSPSLSMPPARVPSPPKRILRQISHVVAGIFHSLQQPERIFEVEGVTILCLRSRGPNNLHTAFYAYIRLKNPPPNIPILKSSVFSLQTDQTCFLTSLNPAETLKKRFL